MINIITSGEIIATIGSVGGRATKSRRVAQTNAKRSSSINGAALSSKLRVKQIITTSISGSGSKRNSGGNRSVEKVYNSASNANKTAVGAKANLTDGTTDLEVDELDEVNAGIWTSTVKIMDLYLESSNVSPIEEWIGPASIIKSEIKIFVITNSPGHRKIEEISGVHLGGVICEAHSLELILEIQVRVDLELHTFSYSSKCKINRSVKIGA